LLFADLGIIIQMCNRRIFERMFYLNLLLSTSDFCR